MINRQEKTPKGFLSESRFRIEAFSSPAIGYSPVYTWMWNGTVTEKETDRNLEEMQRLGIKRLYVLPMPKSFRPTSFPTPMTPEYLTQGYFEAFRYATEKAKKLGMELWLYDEGGWPSGGACGQVMLEDPTLVAERISVSNRTVNASETYTPAPNAECAFLDGIRVFPGDKYEKSGTLTEYHHIRTSFPAVNSADLPDVTKEGTAPLFISLTHEKYAAALGKELGGISVLFTDEPTAPRPFPYNEEIKELFCEKFGRSIEDCLPFLTGKAKCTGEEAQIKVEFWKMLSDLYVDRFLKKEKAWANAHGMTFTGHLDKDDEPNASVTSGCFGLLPALRVFDVPGVDAIRRQIFPPKGKSGLYGKNAFYPTLAASAAAQTGGRHALSESFAVYGAGLSYDEMRYVVNFQAMCGVNLFNMMLVPYARKGYALAGELPHFTEKNYPDLRLFNEYIERISYLFSLGERVARIALYLPAADGIVEGSDCKALASYEELGRELQKRHLAFDIVDDDFLSFATITPEGKITSARASYEAIVLPYAEHLPGESAEALRRFLRAGGKVIAPHASEILGAKVSKDYPEPPFAIEEEGILLAESHTAEGKLYFIMNESGEEKRLSLPAGFAGSYVITPTDGKVLRDGKEINLSSGEIVCLLVTNEDMPAAKPPKPEKELSLKDWSFRPISRLVIAEEVRTEKTDEAYAPTTLGDWRSALGEGFSGTAEYLTTFSLPKGAKDATLDLGKAAHAAEVMVNGTSLGARIMPPYRYEIPSSLLKEENTLVVRVTNGAANEFEGTTAFDKYYPWQLGNYLKEERLFHRDSLESGLFGEVKLYFN